jgi:hypothetical protein
MKISDSLLYEFKMSLKLMKNLIIIVDIAE